MSNARTTSYPQALTERSASRKLPLGTIRDEGSKVYKYIEFNANSPGTASAAGDMMYYEDYDLSLVTGDISAAAGGATDALGAGVLMASLADGEFGWIQTEGRYGPLNTDVGNSPTVNCPVTSHDGADNAWLKRAAGTADEPQIGIMQDVTGSAMVILLQCPR